MYNHGVHVCSAYMHVKLSPDIGAATAGSTRAEATMSSLALSFVEFYPGIYLFK